jgi:hypothetical protein
MSRYQMDVSLFIQISNSGFEFHMMPARGEAVTGMTVGGQQQAVNETVSAATSQTVSFEIRL